MLLPRDLPVDNAGSVTERAGDAETVLARKPP